MLRWEETLPPGVNSRWERRLLSLQWPDDFCYWMICEFAIEIARKIDDLFSFPNGEKKFYVTPPLFYPTIFSPRRTHFHHTLRWHHRRGFFWCRAHSTSSCKISFPFGPSTIPWMETIIHPSQHSHISLTCFITWNHCVRASPAPYNAIQCFCNMQITLNAIPSFTLHPQPCRCPLRCKTSLSFWSSSA